MLDARCTLTIPRFPPRQTRRPPCQRVKSKPARISALRRERSLLQLKRFSNRKLEPRAAECRAAIGDAVEAFRKATRRRKKKKLYGEVELKKFSWTYQKSKISWRSAETWRGLGLMNAMPANVSLGPKFKVGAGRRCDGMAFGCRDLLRARLQQDKNKKKSKSHPSHEIICSALEWCRSMQNCALYSLPASSHKRSKINCAVSFTSHACQPPPLPPSGRRTPKVNSSHESKLNKLIK